MTTKYSAAVMALREVSSECIVLEYFFTKHTKDNTKVCCKVMGDKIIHWMEGKAARGFSKFGKRVEDFSMAEGGHMSRKFVASVCSIY